MCRPRSLASVNNFTALLQEPAAYKVVEKFLAQLHALQGDY